MEGWSGRRWVVCGVLTGWEEEGAGGFERGGDLGGVGAEGKGAKGEGGREVGEGGVVRRGLWGRVVVVGVTCWIAVW